MGETCCLRVHGVRNLKAIAKGNPGGKKFRLEGVSNPLTLAITVQRSTNNFKNHTGVSRDYVSS